MIKKFALVILLACIAPTASYGENPRYDTLKICRMLPNYWTCIPAIEPAIPDNYVAKFQGKLIYWGTEEDLAKINNDPWETPNSPILAFHLNDIIKQNSENTFTNFKHMFNNMKSRGIKKNTLNDAQWGIYPVKTFQGTLSGEHYRCAWIGLFDSGFTLEVDLFNSTDPEKDKLVWNNFIKNTQCLSEKEQYLARGLDAYNGYTYYRSGDAIVKISVEKRFEDDRIAVLIEPITENTTFEFKELKMGMMGGSWKYADLMVKVIGHLNEFKEKGTNMTLATVAVFPKIVDEFSFSTHQGDYNFNVLVFETTQEKKYFE